MHYLLRHLERIPLETPYPTVADRIRSVVSAVSLRAEFDPKVFVDATGLGAPVIDLLRVGSPQLASAVAVIFTSGSKRREHPGQRKLTLGKARVVNRLQALLRTGLLHLPQTAEADALARELMNYEIRVSQNGHVRFGAFKTGIHDDLVTALALAVQ